MAKKDKKNTSKVNAKEILKLFRKKSKPVSAKEIYQVFNPDKAQKESIQNILNSLEEEGKIISIGQGRAYGLIEKMDMVTGTLEVVSSGIGFVLPEDKRRKDVFISPVNMDDAFPGDKVVAALLPHTKGKNPEGRIVRVVERSLNYVPVRIMKKMDSTLFWGQSTHKSVQINYMVDIEDLSRKPEIEEVVLVKPREIMDRGLWAADGIDILGREDDAQVQEKIVKCLYNVPGKFPENVLNATKKLPDEPSEQDINQRRDLRDHPFVTIDGAQAKDFDDAIYIQKTESGYKLFVAIADVTHYVKPGSPLDEEARKRANSYYFLQSVEPMFPEELSNGLCSLNPDTPRLVMVAEMDFTPAGEQKNASFYSAVIQSWGRLTYSQVKRALLDEDPREQDNLGDLYPMLRNAYDLAKLLYAKKRARGSLDFDLPEPEVLFNIQGETTDIKPRVRHFGHQIIEEFMIAANEAVASYLEQNSQPCMFRIHPKPDQDKLASLFNVLKKTDFASKIPENSDPKSLQTLLWEVEDSDLEFLVNRLLLRTMMQASYNPDNQGHFGLASQSYCHFTSPIRRYPDIIVHRSLKNHLGIISTTQLGYKKMLKTGDYLSKQERNAMSAEREILKRLTVLFLKDKIGSTYSGVISSVIDFGFWVELTEVSADGMVRLSSLTDDYYELYSGDQKIVGQRTGKTYVLGQKLNVRLTNVSLSRQEIDLELEENVSD